jgi:3-oxoadipate enol-lactonase
VIALDNRGAGRSDKPFGHYSLEQMADDAIAVLDHVGVDTAHVVGASMGGAISQIVALKHPERVSSLTLACTACRNHDWRRELLTGWATHASERGMGAMTREAARWVIGPRSFRRLLPAFGWLGPLAMGRSSHAFVAQVRAILATDETMADRLGEITIPALVMVGNQDILTPRGDSEEIADRLPNAELVVISGAAHGFMVEHATTFNRVLLEFLGRVTREQASAADALAPTG